MDKDFSDLLSLFDRYEVRYLVVGGFAVMFYSQPRGTKDIDFYVDNERSNIEAAYRALAEYGAPLAGYSVEDLQDPSSVFQIGQPPLRIDIIKELAGVTFAEAWNSRREAMEDGIRVLYIGRDLLLHNKSVVGRQQDLADIEAVQNAVRSVSRKTSGY